MPAQVVAEQDQRAGQEERVRGRPPQAKLELAAVDQIVGRQEVRLAVLGDERRDPQREPELERHRRQQHDRQADGVRVAPHQLQDGVSRTPRRAHRLAPATGAAETSEPGGGSRRFGSAALVRRQQPDDPRGRHRERPGRQQRDQRIERVAVARDRPVERRRGEQDAEAGQSRQQGRAGHDDRDQRARARPGSAGSGPATPAGRSRSATGPSRRWPARRPCSGPAGGRRATPTARPSPCRCASPSARSRRPPSACPARSARPSSGCPRRSRPGRSRIASVATRRIQRSDSAWVMPNSFIRPACVERTERLFRIVFRLPRMNCADLALQVAIGRRPRLVEVPLVVLDRPRDQAPPEPAGRREGAVLGEVPHHPGHQHQRKADPDQRGPAQDRPGAGGCRPGTPAAPGSPAPGRPAGSAPPRRAATPASSAQPQ